jgi:hypothetical protein
MGYTKQDPRWIEAPEDTTCGRCGAPILYGAKAFFYPEKGQALCNTPMCGHAADRLVQSQMGENG